MTVQSKKTISEAQASIMTQQIEGLTTTSSKIRKLAAEGHDRGDIARFLGVIYQHVRNVLVTKTKKHQPE